jgi:hypothetical protein
MQIRALLTVLNRMPYLSKEEWLPVVMAAVMKLGNNSQLLCRFLADLERVCAYIIICGVCTCASGWRESKT